MLTGDLAESPLASCDPDEIRETLNDLLKEATSPHLPPRERAAAFAAIDAVIEEYEREYVQQRPAGAVTAKSIFDFVRSVYGDTRLPDDVRRRAVATAIAAGDPEFGRSYQFYADALCVTRACIHANARNVQDDIGLRNLRDKSDSAREKSRTLASSAHRRERKSVSSRPLKILLPGL